MKVPTKTSGVPSSLRVTSPVARNHLYPPLFGSMRYSTSYRSQPLTAFQHARKVGSRSLGCSRSDQDDNTLGKSCSSTNPSISRNAWLQVTRAIFPAVSNSMLHMPEWINPLMIAKFFCSPRRRASPISMVRFISRINASQEGFCVPLGKREKEDAVVLCSFSLRRVSVKFFSSCSMVVDHSLKRVPFSAGLFVMGM